MSTTGQRYIQRTRDRRASRVIDANTRAVLSAVVQERGDRTTRSRQAARSDRPAL